MAVCCSSFCHYIEGCFDHSLCFAEKNVGGSLFKYAALEWKKLPFPEKEVG